MKNGWSWKKLGDGSLDNMSTSSGCGGRRHSEIVGYALNETQATAQDPEAPFSSTASGVENSSSCSCHGRA